MAIKIDLLQMKELGKFKKGLKKRLKIDGKTDEYDSYLIPIKYLFYNDMNGRIATYNQEYKDENHGKDLISLLKEDQDAYNKIVAEFIKKSASDNNVSYNKTKKDIMKNGQQVPGVVLSDGRIIDGNRRFTCISDLYEVEHSDEFEYFEAVILPAPEKNDINQWRKIKSLELNLQFNVDEKKDYNRIDFLVSFYENTMNPDTKFFDKKQYCYESGIKTTEYDKNVRIVKVMLDYLKWRNKPNAFYILKKYKLDGPIEDLANTCAKMTDEEYNRIKTPIYQYMTLVTSGDRTRDIRALIKSAKNNGTLFKNYCNSIDNKNDAIKILQAVQYKDIPAESKEATEKRNDVLASAETIIVRSFEDANYDATLEQCKKAPYDKLQDALKSINTIDVSMISNLEDGIKGQMKNVLSEIKKIITRIEGKL